MSEGGQRTQTSGWQGNGVGDLMYSEGTVVNDTVLYICKLLREQVLKPLSTQTDCNYAR